MSEIANWIGLGLTTLGMALGGMAYVQNKVEKVKDTTDKKLEDQKKELEYRHTTDLNRVEKLLDEERTERRRELDRVEETVKGFADVASAVIAMGKSVEHLAERFTDHQRLTERSLEEIKSELKTRPVPARRTRATKGA